MIWEEVIITIFRTIFTFVFMLVLTRLMGRKAISQMTSFDFVVGITIGAIGAYLAVSDMKLPYATSTAMVIFTLLAIMTDIIHVKNFRFYKLVESEPVVVIENGKINNDNLKRIKFTLVDLTKMLREKDIFNVADVEFALIENDGELSVLLKSQKQPLTPEDLKVSTGYKGLTKDLIIDGRIMSENLADVTLNEMWLYNQLRDQGIQDASEVFYAGLDTLGNLYVSRKMKSEEKHGKYGIE